MYKDFRLGFSNIKEEIIEPVSLQIDGKFPLWLSGTLYRNGPGVFKIPHKSGNGSYTVDHWFDGLTVIHKFSIENGKVTFMNRHMSKDQEERIAETGRNFGVLFGTDPCKSIFKKFSTFFEMGNITNIPVTLGKVNEEYWAKTDADSIMKFDPDTLEHKGIFHYSEIFPGLKGILSASHSQFDLERREFLNYVCDIGRSGVYTVFRLEESNKTQETEKTLEKVEGNEDGKVIGTILAQISGDPCYVHSFAVTRNYFILILWPALLNPLSMIWDKSIEGALDWKPSKGTLFHVIDRINGGHKATYKGEAFFSFHNINAFEENGNIILDLTAYSDLAIVESLRYKNLMEGQGEKAGRVVRFTLENIAEASIASPLPVKEKILSPHNLEMPRFNQNFHMKRYHFSYGIGFKNSNIWDCLIKLDHDTGELVYWEEKECYPGEPIFVPDPQGNGEEDEGVLLSIVLSSAHQKSFLLVLDAKTMKELGRAWAPQWMPFSFHGNYFPASGDRVDQ